MSDERHHEHIPLL